MEEGKGGKFGNNNDSSDQNIYSEAENADSLQMLLVKGTGCDTPKYATLA